MDFSEPLPPQIPSPHCLLQSVSLLYTVGFCFLVAFKPPEYVWTYGTIGL